MAQEPTNESLHTICAWTFNDGKKGFTPAIRPEWSRLSTVDKIHITREEIQPRVGKISEALKVPITLGFEVHCDSEIDEDTAESISHALTEETPKIYLGMITPGAHSHYAFGGSASLDPKERQGADTLARRTVDIAYDRMADSWHPRAGPTLVLWNGSWGYHLASPAIPEMRRKLIASLGDLCNYELEKGGLLRIAGEPKGNEGHAHMLVPNSGSMLALWNDIEREYSLDGSRYGNNIELGHEEMLGLDSIYAIAEGLASRRTQHMHLNSQGGSDGINLGGPGKFDIDHEFKVNGTGIVIARMLQDAKYALWQGHDMQPRPYDEIGPAKERIIRGICAWESCRVAGRELDVPALLQAYSQRNTIAVEDMMRHATVQAHNTFDSLYEASR